MQFLRFEGKDYRAEQDYSYSAMISYVNYVERILKELASILYKQVTELSTDLYDPKISTTIQAATNAISQQMAPKFLPLLQGQRPCKC